MFEATPWHRQYNRSRRREDSRDLPQDRILIMFEALEHGHRIEAARCERHHLRSASREGRAVLRCEHCALTAQTRCAGQHFYKLVVTRSKIEVIATELAEAAPRVPVQSRTQSTKGILDEAPA